MENPLQVEHRLNGWWMMRYCFLFSFLHRNTQRGDQYELIRWPGTVAVLALLLVLCAVLLVGVARHSRW